MRKLFSVCIPLLLLAGVFEPLALADTLEFEIAVRSTASRKRYPLSLDDEGGNRHSLRDQARNQALDSVIQICASLAGRLGPFACEREYQTGIVKKFGGKTGYHAYGTNVTVSARCVIDSNQLSWLQERWYGYWYPSLPHCPSHRVIMIGQD